MRIAEFSDLSDASAFRKLKGEHYEVIGGVSLQFAVALRPAEAIAVDRSEPADYAYTRGTYEDWEE